MLKTGMRKPETGDGDPKDGMRKRFRSQLSA